MELPFKNTTTEFEKEFKEALGFSDIDIPYRKIKPDLNLAATYLIKTVGNSVYNALIGNYKLNKESDANASAPYQDEQLNEAFQFAIASYGYMEYAPSNDLAHTPNGRRMRSSENEKTPFEWMIAKDDDNLQRKAFKAIDALINYMDEHLDVWKASEAFKATHKLYVRTLSDFSQAYVLESRLLLLKLAPGLLQCERREIKPRLGKELNDILKEKIIYKASGQTGDNTQDITEDEALLIDYIKEACAYYSLSWAFPRLQVTMFPEGILQSVRSERNTIKGRVSPQVPVIDQAAKQFMADAEHAFFGIETQYKKMFPPEEIEPQKETEEDQYGFGDNDNFITT